MSAKRIGKDVIIACSHLLLPLSQCHFYMNKKATVKIFCFQNCSQWLQIFIHTFFISMSKVVKIVLCALYSISYYLDSSITHLYLKYIFYKEQACARLERKKINIGLISGRLYTLKDVKQAYICQIKANRITLFWTCKFEIHPLQLI